MEYRKLIKFGNSSHIISIPTKWIKKNKLKKGNLIYFRESGDGELILNTKITGNKTGRKEITIEERNLEDLRKSLISNYIGGCDIITIKINNSKELRDIKFFLGFLMTFEIIDQKKDKIVTKDLLDLGEISVDKIIKRMDILIRSMFEESKLSHKEKNLEEIKKIDYEVNKLFYLGLRIIKKCLQDPQIIEKVGLNKGDMVEYWELFNAFERIGDIIKRISEHMSKIKDIEELKIGMVIKQYDKVNNEYLKAINSWHKKDIEMAKEVSSKNEKIIKECDRLSKSLKNSNLISILENVKFIEMSIKDICRNVYQ